MDKLKFVLLAVDNNDYQVEQVSSAQSAASRLGIEIEIIHTEHDSIQQSQIVLDLIHGPPGKRPNAIFFEPVGTARAQPARAVQPDRTEQARPTVWLSGGLGCASRCHGATAPALGQPSVLPESTDERDNSVCPVDVRRANGW